MFSGIFQDWYPVLEVTVMLYILFPGVPLQTQAEGRYYPRPSSYDSWIDSFGNGLFGCGSS